MNFGTREIGCKITTRCNFETQDVSISQRVFFPVLISLLHSYAFLCILSPKSFSVPSLLFAMELAIKDAAVDTQLFGCLSDAAAALVKGFLYEPALRRRRKAL